MSFVYDDHRVAVLLFCALMAFTISVPFNILLIITLVRYRKTNDFSFPFFRMLLSLSINDLITAAISAVTFFMFCLPHEPLAKYAVSWHEPLIEGTLSGGLAGDVVILLAIGINRLIAYVFPTKTIWKPHHTRNAIIVQWFYNLLIGLTCIHPDLHPTYYLNETTGILVEVVQESSIYQIKNVITTLIVILAGLALAIVYGVCVAKLVYHKLTINIGQESQNLAAEAKLSFQGFVLSFSMIVGACLYGYGLLQNFAVSLTYFALLFIVGVTNFIFGPFIVIGMSKNIRKHIRKLFVDDNVVHVLPANNHLPCQQSQV